MLIAQASDIHIGFDREHAGEELNVTRFRAVIDRLQAAPQRPDLLVLSGDLTDDGDDTNFATLRDLLKSVRCDVLPLVGNHDKREGLRKAFAQVPQQGFVQYAIEREGLRVICLDSMEAGRHGGAFCEERRDWLRAQLAQGAGKPCVIFMHHPPIVSGIDWMDPDGGDEWIAVFGSAIDGFEADIRAIHCGHLHRRISAQFRGIPVGVAPSTAPLVALDLRPIEPDAPDGRPLITSEPPSYALHLWEAGQLVTHHESCGQWEVLARFDPSTQSLVRHIREERG